MKLHPPKSALKFLRWFCREDYLEEIEGDLTEIFEKQSPHSPGKARRKFTWSVIKYFRPGFIRSFNTRHHANATTMLRHNFLIIYRNFLRHKGESFINLAGLSTGLACALLICLWVNDELNVDKFHQKDQQLFQVMIRSETAAGIEAGSLMPPVMAETLADEMPEVEYAAGEAITPVKCTLSVNDKSLKARGAYADKDYFNLFSYDLIRGDKNQVLSDESNMVISEALAKELFNTPENSIGRSVEFEGKGSFIVSGIFTIPRNSSVQFDFILPFSVQFKHYPNLKNDWSNSWANTHIVLKEGTDVDHFNDKIRDLIKRKTGQEHLTLFVRPYSETYLYGNYENGLQTGGRIEYVRLFSIIAIFILLIACINFMNLSTAKASRRSKEVGIKKAVGASRKTLISQHLQESMVMAFSSLFISILLVLLLLPAFSEITGKQLTLQIDTNIILSFLGITFFTGLIAGSYPALYLSGFNPVAVLKGKLSTSFGELLTRKGLIVFQFVLSVVLMVGVLVIYLQMDLIQNKNMGYHKDNVISFEMEGKVKEHLDAFLSEVKNIPGVTNASSIWWGLLGERNGTSDLSWQGKDANYIVDMQYRRVNYGMIEVLGMEMNGGRTFSRDFNDDNTRIIFNEAAIEKMGLKDPIGKHVNLWQRDCEILGVVKDFHFQSLHESVKPLFFFLAPERTNTIMVKIDPENLLQTLDKLQMLHKQFTQGLPLDFKFLDEEFQAQYVAEKRVAVLSRYFAGLGIIISSLGLFGLTTFTAERRAKEIGIRKILGASNLGIVRLLSDDFTKMVLLAILIAWPISFLLAKNWLAGFAYRIDLEWWLFIGAGLLALLIAWLTIGIQTVKAARINPSECLRSE